MGGKEERPQNNLATRSTQEQFTSLLFAAFSSIPVQTPTAILLPSSVKKMSQRMETSVSWVAVLAWRDTHAASALVLSSALVQVLTQHLLPPPRPRPSSNSVKHMQDFGLFCTLYLILFSPLNPFTLNSPFWKTFSIPPHDSGWNLLAVEKSKL